MAKDKKTLVMDKYAGGMFLRQEQYAQRVKSYYDVAVGKLLSLAAQVKNDVGDKAFRFSDNPRIKDETTKTIRLLYSQVYAEIQNGVQTEWELANASCDALVGSCFNWKNTEQNLFARYFERNKEAMDQFFKRKSAHGGLNLSQKVWKYTGDLRTEMENAITVSLGEGVSAATMSRRVRQYLQYPDKLFRRVKGSDGKLHLSKNARAFHPGAGVYRSSYKNAMRLTRTETNAAYRAATQDRWQKMDFVVGMRVHKSNNHPMTDICDILCGDYPKEFKFTAWHPQCRCYVTSILCTPDELVKMNQDILQGKSVQGFRSVNEVREMPKCFTDWVSDNRYRIIRAKAVPYFIKDNYKYGNVDKGLKWEKEKLTPQEIGAQRHAARTQADIDDIQRRWNKKRLIDNGCRFDIANIEKCINDYGVPDNKWRDFLTQKLTYNKRKMEIEGVDDIVDWYREEAVKVFQQYDAHISPMRNLLNKVKSEKAGAKGAKLQAEIQTIYDSYKGKFAHYATSAGAKEVKADWLKKKVELDKLLTHRKDVKARWDARRTANAAKGIGTAPSTLDEVNKKLADAKIESRPVLTEKEKRTEEQIISALGGADKTEGSCSSLAFAWAGNKSGLDVLDFRGGDSREWFATQGNINDITKQCNGIIEKHNNDITASHKLFKTMEDGKQYYFCTGCHAAVIRKTATGYEYLELQSETNNGWHELNDYVLKWRFSAQKSHTYHRRKYLCSNCLIDIEELGTNAGFSKTLSYINTAKEAQMKGIGGSIK